MTLAMRDPVRLFPRSHRVSGSGPLVSFELFGYGFEAHPARALLGAVIGVER